MVLHRDGDGAVLHWFVIEMKSRPRRPGSIAEQLQAGANILQMHARFRLPQKVSGLVPVLVKSRGIKNTDLDEIRRKRIRFQGQDYLIRIENCGANLAAMLPQARKAR